MPLGSFLSVAATKNVILPLVQDITKSAKAALGQRAKMWRTERTVEALCKKIKAFRHVKTIWQVEREVDLAKFYYPSKVRASGVSTPINDIDDLKNRNTIIQGTVGQGKSIFLRYLAARELQKGKTVPIFLELRRIQASRSLDIHLLSELDSLGLGSDPLVFDYLASNGRLALFLDAFDEVNEDSVLDTVTEIERLARKYDSLRIFITSRPNSTIVHSPLFRLVDLAPLEGKEYQDVIRRICTDSPTAEAIIKGVRTRQGDVIPLLTTPLMVALLVFKFRAAQTIPENASSFFESLFQLLLVRHDKSKPGYTRPRRSGLGDNALENIFNVLCFLTRKAGRGTFSLRDLRTLTIDAVKLCQSTADGEKVLDDFIKITCLILEEGGDCRFLHKSVQEYHSACFIRGRPEQSKLDFYESMLHRWNGWRQELAHLEQIDEYHFNKYFTIPHLAKVLEIPLPVPAEWTPSKELIVGIFGKDGIGYSEKAMGLRRITYASNVKSWFLNGEDHSSRHGMWELVSEVDAELRSVLKERGIKSFVDQSGESSLITVRISDLIEHKTLGAKCEEHYRKKLSTFHRRLLNAHSMVSRTDEAAGIMRM